MNQGVRAAVEVAKALGLAPENPLLQHALASELRAAGAETARPLGDMNPVRHESTGLLVTFWEHLPGVPRADLAPDELATSLKSLHAAVAGTKTRLPSYLLALDRARNALDDDEETGALNPADRSRLRSTLDETGGLPPGDRRLHGEPRDANRLVADGAIRWLDLEAACVGPVEWDLSFQPHEVSGYFEGGMRPFWSSSGG